MFPTIMPWPMTLAPTNKAIKHENHVEKNLIIGGELPYDLGGHVRCKDSITIYECQVL